MNTLSVDLGERSYPIHIGSGLCTNASLIPPALLKGKAVIVTNQTIAPLYLEAVTNSLRNAGAECIPIVLPDGEAYKSLETLNKIFDALLTHRCERKTPLIALGGGVIGDLTGFAAATYQRGVPFIQIPTTLLSQVDSAVGGKTAVNHPLGKNMIGAFYQPQVVIADMDTLRTLPPREFAAGLAEVIKYGIIADRSFFAYLERTMPSLLKLDSQAVMQIIKRSCEIKAQVVAEDEQESDRRRILNYGHTIGHALEALGGYRSLIHGEAVGIGLVLEADLARHQGYCDAGTVERIRSLVLAAGLSDRPTSRSAEKVWTAMQHDKKVSQGKVVGVWPESIGQVRIAPVEETVFTEWFQTVSVGAGGRSSRAGRR
mgnify:CR=1 FL=1